MDPLYLIEHFDPADRRAWFSCDRNWMRRNVVERIADNELDCVVKVLEIREDEKRLRVGEVRNVTREIADDVETFVLENRGGMFSYEVLSFLQSQGLRQHQMAE